MMIMMRRKKGLLFVSLILFTLIYFTWLINLSCWQKCHSSQIQVFEMFEAYDKQLNVSEKKYKFVLLASRNSYLPNLLYSNTPRQNLIQEKLNDDELVSLFKLFISHKVFLIDVNRLKELKAQFNLNVATESSYSANKVILKLPKYHLKRELVYITFGINLHDFEQFHLNLEQKVNKQKCELVYGVNDYSEEKVLTNMYILCKKLTVQIALFYERGSFLWIGDDRYRFTDKKVFGDKPRALNNFYLNHMVDDDFVEFFIPANLDKFLFDYEHSTFLECNRQLAKSNLDKYGKNYTQNESRNKMISPVMQHISRKLESLGKHYWLAGGTLLGWYRDCGIIPHTQDVDMAVWAHEYDNRIKRHFLGNKLVRLWGSLGLKNDSYEFRLFNDKFTFDLFFVYDLNSTHQWCGYQVNRYKFRRFLPNFNKLCSAELLNHKYMVPCDVVEYLDYEYGENNWQEPKASNYKWTNVFFWKNWTDAEWPNTIRYYDKHGKLLKQKIIDYLNKHATSAISELPFDDYEDLED